MKTIKIGIIGAAGLRGAELFTLFSGVDADVRVTAVCDNDSKLLAQKYAEAGYCLELYGDNHHFLSSNSFDTLVVATPDKWHEEHACAALEAGKHVYLEKPMAITPNGCNRIMAAAQKNNRVLYVGHNLRHFTVIKKLKEVIDSGAVGEVKAIWCQHAISYGRQMYFNDWHQYQDKVGSLLIHKAAHDLDIIHWLAGSHTKRVVAMGQLAVWGDQPGHPDVEDLSTLLLELDNGVQATYAQCHFAHMACREYTIIGTKGTVRNLDDNPARAVVQLFGKRRADAQTIPTQEWRFSPESGFHGMADKRIVAEFIGILRGELQPTISAHEAAWAAKTGFAATHSLRHGNMPVLVF